jgi:peptidoglycan/xylan/chitin deacetylase (PgdA/CDA1 family)
MKSSRMVLSLVLLAVAIIVTALFPQHSPSPSQTPLTEEQTTSSRPMEHGPMGRHQIALTFDAEGGDEGMADLLSVLQDGRVSATFFLTGKWADEHPAWASLIADSCHIIGNHSWGHRDPSQMEAWEVQQEVMRVEDRFVSLYGTQYRKLYRLPYPVNSAPVHQLVKSLGYHIVGWSIDSLDDSPPPKSAAFITNRILQHSNEDLDGAILHFTVGRRNTIEALPVLIAALRERGFEFATIADWLPEAELATPQ